MRQEHWNRIFATRSDSELGWYEADAAQTLQFLELVPASPAETIFVAGAGTSVLVEALLARGARLILNDVSDAALEKLRRRIGAQPGRVAWLCHDIASPLPTGLPPVDLWIDRAVLHFLLDEADIAGYFANLHAMLRPGGHVLLAEFAGGGAPKCAGLDVHRYSFAELAARLGPGFQPLRFEEYIYRNSAGEPRPYVYGLFRRNGRP